MPTPDGQPRRKLPWWLAALIAATAFVLIVWIFVPPAWLGDGRWRFLPLIGLVAFVITLGINSERRFYRIGVVEAV